MKTVFAAFMILTFCSCSILNSGNNIFTGESGTINIELNNTNLILLPMSPLQAESAYADAITWMNTTPHVDNDTNQPGIYYVTLFLTNAEQYKDLLRYYILYSPLPYASLETNEDMIRLTKQTGRLDSASYSNVFPVFAIITSVHYNAFLDENIFVFRNIRQIEYQELASLNFSTNYINDYNERMDQLGIERPNLSGSLIMSKGFLDWLVQAIVQVIKVIADIVGTGVSLLTPRATVWGSVTYSGYDTGYKASLSGIVPGVWIKNWYLLGSISGQADGNGNYSIKLTKGWTYNMQVELNSHYAWIGLIWPDAYYCGDITVPDQDSARININMNNRDGYAMGSLYECFSFSFENGLGILPPRVRLFFMDSDEWGGFAVNNQFLVFLFGDTICINGRYPFNKYTIAHEYGHLLHFTGIKNKNPLFTGFYYFFSGNQIVYPDGNTDDLYYNDSMCYLTEGIAEFYAIAYSLSKYPYCSINEIRVRNIENNYGSKEMTYGSSTLNSDSIGSATIDSQTFHLYSWRFNRYYYEASILFDLWDNNTMQHNSTYMFTVNQNKGWCIPTTLLKSEYFSTSELSQPDYFNINFSANAIRSREIALDKISIPMRKIFDMACNIDLFSPGSPFYYQYELEYRIRNSAASLGVSSADIEDLLRLHSFNTMEFTEPQTVWTNIQPNAPFGPRADFGLVSLNGNIYLIGGSIGYSVSNLFRNDVWRSSDGITWICLTTNAGFSPRSGFGCVVFNNRIWVMGGSWSSDNDVWSSADGVIWECATTTALPFPLSDYSACVFNNNIWIIGGVTTNGPSYCIWNSQDGTNWNYITSNLNIPPDPHHVVTYKNNLWTISGGKTMHSFDGTNWTTLDTAQSIENRFRCALAITSNSILISGGHYWHNGLLIQTNDIWISTDGTNWISKSPAAEFSPRMRHSAVFNNGKTFVIGGTDTFGSNLNDVWIEE